MKGTIANSFIVLTLVVLASGFVIAGSSDVSADPVDTYEGLDQSIATASPGDVIVLGGDITVDDWNQITINVNGLTIDGDGHKITVNDTIKSSELGGALFHSKGDTTFRNLTVVLNVHEHTKATAFIASGGDTYDHVFIHNTFDNVSLEFWEIPGGGSVDEYLFRENIIAGDVRIVVHTSSSNILNVSGNHWGGVPTVGPDGQIRNTINISGYEVYLDVHPDSPSTPDL